MKKEKSKVDVPVLILFFTRDKQLREVFNSVKNARPSKLYLYQDGPRNEKDNEGIEKCRSIVSEENIDWDCEVYRLYKDENYGCDPSNFMAQKWMFSKEKYGIVLEDDSVPAQSFYPYCKDLLERYKDDQRINMICGMNNTGISEYLPYSYTFTHTSGSIWGWATWKRVIDEWEEYIDFVDDKFYVKLFNEKYKKLIDHKSTLARIKMRNDSKIPHYEEILGSNVFMNNRLNIIPKYNMIRNIGITEDAVHASGDIRIIPKAIRNVFFMKTYEINFPLKHPKYIVDDVVYAKNVNRLMGYGHPLVKIYRNFEVLILKIRYGYHKDILKSIKRKLG